MNLLVKSLSVVGQFGVVLLLMGAFAFGMAGVVYMSLSGSEIKVPEIVGKDFVESEKELEALGLKIKKRADRPSTEKINTILEQLPKAGETVKTGQMILVVVSKAGVEGEAIPDSLKQDIQTDDTEKIEEMISDKPRKTRTSTNSSRKKADTSRDTNSNESNSNKSGAGDSDNKSDTKEKKESANPAASDDRDRNTDKPVAKPQSSPGSSRPSSPETRPKPTIKP